MILINDDTPRWIRELDRFVHLKSLLFVHGNVLDLVSYPVQPAGSDRAYWTEGDISQFFQRYLISQGYECVGLFDPLDGMSFANPPMETLFRQILRGHVKEEDAAKARATDASREPSAAPMRNSNAPIDPDVVMQDVSRVMANREIPSAFVFNFSSRLLSSPDMLSRHEQILFTRMLKACLGSREVVRPGGQRWNNVLILVCDKLNDLPAFLYFNNPRSRAIQVDKPDSNERARFLQSNQAGFYRGEQEAELSKDIANQFSMLTEGFSYYEMLSLLGLSLREQIGLEQIALLCDHFKYGITESDWDKLDKSRLDRAGQLIRTRIKGQEPAVLRLLEVIKRAKLGLAAGTQKRNQRPRGVLFFAGPTGVGKTEMAKGLAELLFGQEERLIRFDMSEYASQHADQKLLGAPPGYVGYEQGGKLTNAMKEQPFSVLLFDEIEKAHPSIFDKFLQILDDGRLTDGQGDTVYFSECIIIFTSNLGTVARQEGGGRQELVNPDMSYHQVHEIILRTIREHFNYELGRPEILNRFGDNFVVFDFIRPEVAEQIVEHLLRQLLNSLAEQQKIHLRLSRHVRDTLVKLSQERLEHGGRGIRNLLDAALINPLAASLFDHNVQAGARLRVVDLKDNGEQSTQRFEITLAKEKETDAPAE